MGISKLFSTDICNTLEKSAMLSVIIVFYEIFASAVNEAINDKSSLLLVMRWFV